MLRLPELSAGSARWRLPLTDVGASHVLAAMLADDSAVRIAAYDAALRTCPALLLWTVCRYPHWSKQSPRNVQEVAEILAQQDEPLLAPSPSTTWSTSSASAVDVRCVALCRQSVSVAEMAASLAAESVRSGDATEPLVDQVYVLGLLHAAPRWLANYGPRVKLSPGQRQESPLPRWLTRFVRESHGAKSGTRPATFVSAARQQLRRRPAAAEAKKPEAPAPVSGEEALALARVAHLLPGLARQQQRLQQLEASFGTTLEQEKLESLRQLAYGASHEINNPLANISTRAQTLLREEQDPERHRKLATINAQAFRAHEMIADMMLFAKPPQLVRTSVDAIQLVDEVLAEIEPFATDQGIQLAHPTRDESVVMQADRVQLAAALKSLCVNSLEAMGGDGRIEVQAAARPSTEPNGPGWVEITVRDTGPGIPTEVRRHLFDPFFSGREAGRGLGLGLSKCYRIVALHGGQIDVKSEAGQGATFRIRLPVAEPVET